MSAETSSEGRWLLVVVTTVFLEAIALLLGAGAYVVELLGGFAEQPGMAAFMLVFAAGMGAVLIWSAQSLRRGKRWARGPIFTWQLFQLAVAVPLAQGSTPWIGVLLLIAVIVVIVGLFTPSVVRVTTDRSGPSAVV